MIKTEPLNGWMVYPRYTANRSDNAFSWLAEEAARNDIKIDIVFLEDLAPTYGANGSYAMLWKGEVAELPGFVIMREYDAVISRHFELAGIPVINNWQSMMLCKNKMLTHQMLARAGMPTPDTVYNPAGEYDYDELAKRFATPEFIIKRIDGAKGEDVFLIKNPKELQNATKKCGGKCICQKYIDHSRGRDVRVWVIGGRAVAGVLRYSETSFLSNYSQGGKVAPFELTTETKRLCEEAARLFGLEFCGVDLLFTPEGFTICEINGNAGFRTLSVVGENNIPSILFAHIAAKYGKNE